MKVSQLLAATTNTVPHILLVDLPVFHSNESVGSVAVFALVPNLQSEEVKELVISVEVSPSSEIEDESYTVSHQFNLDLRAYPSIESLEQAVLIELQNGLINAASSCGSISDDLEQLLQEWDGQAPLEYEVPSSFHVFDLASNTANSLSQHLKSFHAICNE
jgi:hypothetical protein